MHERRTVLYVDDNPKTSRLLTAILESCEFHVVQAHNPSEALCLCRQTVFDLALLDYDMPQTTGAELARDLKLCKPDLPVVLISGCAALPPTELAFVDAHYGLGTCLDDLLWGMRVLTAPSPLVVRHQPIPSYPNST